MLSAATCAALVAGAGCKRAVGKQVGRGQSQFLQRAAPRDQRRDIRELVEGSAPPERSRPLEEIPCCGWGGRGLPSRLLHECVGAARIELVRLEMQAVTGAVRQEPGRCFTEVPAEPGDETLKCRARRRRWFIRPHGVDQAFHTDCPRGRHREQRQDGPALRSRHIDLGSADGNPQRAQHVDGKGRARRVPCRSVHRLTILARVPLGHGSPAL